MDADWKSKESTGSIGHFMLGKRGKEANGRPAGQP